MTRALALLLILAALGCDSGGDARFGERCTTGDDCASGVCVGGEAPGIAAFCSEDCGGRATGTVCGGRGKCVADFVSWCWLPCAADQECAAVNTQRPTCVTLSSGGKPYPFSVCSSGARGDAGVDSAAD